jgi:hypothetical protein
MADVNESDPKLMDLRAATLAVVQRLLEHQAPNELSMNGEI